MKTFRTMSAGFSFSTIAVLLTPVVCSLVSGCGQDEGGDSISAAVPQPAAAASVVVEAGAAKDAPQATADEVTGATPETGSATTPVTLVLAKNVKVEKGWGDISGQILFDGEVSEPKLVVTGGDPSVKDSAVCAATDMADNTLLVDPKTKGVANAFVYIFHRKAKGMKIHPEAAEIKEDETEIVFDQKSCRFIPHVMVVRIGQTVLIKSADNISHNTHTATLFNDEFNSIIKANDRVGVPLEMNAPESLPMPVKCDIHPWMKAHWLIINHPYATVTDEQGRFKIEKLPVGEIEFRIWHERPGYIDKKYVVTVEEGLTELEPVQVPAEKFER